MSEEELAEYLEDEGFVRYGLSLVRDDVEVVFYAAYVEVNEYEDGDEIACEHYGYDEGSKILERALR